MTAGFSENRIRNCWCCSTRALSPGNEIAARARLLKPILPEFQRGRVRSLDPYLIKTWFQICMKGKKYSLCVFWLLEYTLYLLYVNSKVFKFIELHRDWIGRVYFDWYLKILIELILYYLKSASDLRCYRLQRVRTFVLLPISSSLSGGWKMRAEQDRRVKWGYQKNWQFAQCRNGDPIFLPLRGTIHLSQTQFWVHLNNSWLGARWNVVLKWEEGI